MSATDDRSLTPRLVGGLACALAAGHALPALAGAWPRLRPPLGIEDRIAAATGRAPALYRPPYGILNACALALARRRGWRTLLWSHWGRDWEARATAQSIAARATGGAGPGSVLLLHDADDYSAPGSWRRTAAALPLILEALASRGLAPVAA